MSMLPRHLKKIKVKAKEKKQVDTVPGKHDDAESTEVEPSDKYSTGEVRGRSHFKK